MCDFIPLTEDIPEDLERTQFVFSPTPIKTTPNRQTLPLAKKPFVFSQSSLLSASDFTKEASRRRIKIDLALLEDLHRTSLLIPFFGIFENVPNASANTKLIPTDTEMTHPIGNNSAIFSHFKEGKLFDPVEEGFKPWNRVSEESVQPSESVWSFEYRYLYSPYQLLALEQLKRIIAGSVKVVRNTSRVSGLKLNPGMLMRSSAATTMMSWRSLAVVLHTIDARYLPSVVRKVSNATEWPQFAKRFSAKAELNWLDANGSEIRETAQILKNKAKALDVSGDFYELLRCARPDKWMSLKGEALQSFDFRIAAELLDMFVDDIEEMPIVDLVRTQPRLESGIPNGRLLARPRSIDNILTEMGLSPYPSLVIGVEGQTEELILPRVFELLGYHLDPTWIRIERFGGVGKDLTLLARYAAKPLLGADHGNFALLDRPFTRLLILVDAENNKPRNYITFKDREKQRNTLVNEILSGIDERFHKELKSAEAKIVTIRTWNKYPFEFAHFSNRELANGLTSVAGCEPKDGIMHLLGRIEDERRKHRPKNGSSADIKRVFKECFPNVRFSKVSFANEMWPALERKIGVSFENQGCLPPILKNANTALKLASLPRNSLAIGAKKRYPME
jgi:hypothetical protein